MCNFEFNKQKCNSNLSKHGIDFVQAQRLWDDPDVVEVQAKVSNEPRSLVIGRIAGKHWSAVITYRNENIRIISVRQSRDSEVALYEN
jgi:uncharacterized DUF497 family protein